MGRTGYVSGTLAVREGLRAPLPALDPRPLLSMADMGMGGMDHGGMGMSAMAGMDHGGMDMSAMAGMDHGSMDRDAMSGMQTQDRKSTRLNSSQECASRMPSVS